MSSLGELVHNLKTAAQSGQDTQLNVTYGELTDYDPKTHQGKFLLPLHRDPETDEPLEIGPMQIGTVFTGVGYGMQFPPCMNAQALIIYVDVIGKFLPVVATFLPNDVENVPFPDGKQSGWKDKTGNQIKSTVDGATPGDGLGGTTMHSSSYTNVETQGGHQYTQSDSQQQVKQKTAGGHVALYDDAGQVIKFITIGNTLKTVMDNTTQEISHVSPHVGLGDLIANLNPTNQAVIRYIDMANALNTNARQAMGNLVQQLCQAIITNGGIPDAAHATALLAAVQGGLPSLSFVNILSSVASMGTLPSGSSIVLAKD